MRKITGYNGTAIDCWVGIVALMAFVSLLVVSAAHVASLFLYSWS